MFHCNLSKWICTRVLFLDGKKKASCYLGSFYIVIFLDYKKGSLQLVYYSNCLVLDGSVENSCSGSFVSASESSKKGDDSHLESSTGDLSKFCI